MADIPAPKIPVSTPTEPKAPLLLVAEDSVPVRTALVRGLKAQGFNTLTAENGEQALYMMRNYGKLIDGVVTDYNMCGEGRFNGDYFLREMVREGIAPKPVVLYTSEPGTALAAMSDVLGIRHRSEYTDTPERDMQDAVVGDVVHLTKHRFANPENGLTLHVVPKTVEVMNDIGKPDGIAAHLAEMGVTAPPGENRRAGQGR